MRHYNTVKNCLSFDMRNFLINENKQNNLRPHYIILYKKIKPGEFEVCNMKCFESGPRINKNSMGSVDPDLHPSSSLKWTLKIGQKQRNFLFVELSERLEESPRARKVNIFLWGLNKYMLVFLLNVSQFLSYKPCFMV